jgi:hypothetical protein
MHGRQHQWVALRTAEPPFLYVRLDPMSSRLELTQLYDSTAKWLASWDQIDHTVGRLALHGTSFGLHQTRVPLHSVNTLSVRSDAIELIPGDRHRLFLFLA